jgi:hypothetical protein
MSSGQRERVERGALGYPQEMHKQTNLEKEL